MGDETLFLAADQIGEDDLLMVYVGVQGELIMRWLQRVPVDLGGDLVLGEGPQVVDIDGLVLLQGFGDIANHKVWIVSG